MNNHFLTLTKDVYICDNYRMKLLCNKYETERNIIIRTRAISMVTSSKFRKYIVSICRKLFNNT